MMPQSPPPPDRKYRLHPGVPEVGRYKVDLKNVAVEKHCKARILITFAYLILLRRICGRRQGLRIRITPSSLQATTKGIKDNQRAHQLLREVSADHVFLWALAGIEPDEKRALVYCCSAVSDIPANYNTADSKIEQEFGDAYLELALACAGPNPPSNRALFERLIEIFVTAATIAAEKYQFAKDRHGVPLPVENREQVIGIINQYIHQARELGERGEKYMERDADGWLRKYGARVALIAKK